MKVLLLNGSPRANGNTAMALKEVEKTLNQQGVETEVIHVGHKPIHGCISCNKCWDEGKCAFDDIVNEISKKMEECSGIVVGSPVYFASGNGALISLLDRLFYSNLTHDWSMKVGATVSVARRAGTTATMDQLNKYFLMTNMPVVPSQYWNIIHGCDPGDVEKDGEGMQTMRQMALNMVFMMKSFELGMKEFGSPKIQEEPNQTNFIR